MTNDNHVGFLRAPETTPAAQALFDADIADDGYVMNLSRIWAYLPQAQTGLFDLLREVNELAGFTLRERGVLVLATATTLGDSYCVLAWSGKLAAAGDEAAALAVVRGDDGALSDSERALAAWARRVVRGPVATTAQDVQALRDAGWDDSRIFAATVFVALRLAFSTVNDALGARPDAQLAASLPPALLDAVTFGRPVADA